MCETLDLSTPEAVEKFVYRVGDAFGYGVRHITLAMVNAARKMRGPWNAQTADTLRRSIRVVNAVDSRHGMLLAVHGKMETVPVRIRARGEQTVRHSPRLVPGWSMDVTFRMRGAWDGDLLKLALTRVGAVGLRHLASETGTHGRFALHVRDQSARELHVTFRGTDHLILPTGLYYWR